MNSSEEEVARKLINWVRNGTVTDYNVVAKLNHFLHLLQEATNPGMIIGTESSGGDGEQGICNQSGYTAESPPITKDLSSFLKQPDHGFGRDQRKVQFERTSTRNMGSTGFIPTIKETRTLHLPPINASKNLSHAPEKPFTEGSTRPGPSSFQRTQGQQSTSNRSYDTRQGYGPSYKIPQDVQAQSLQPPNRKLQSAPPCQSKTDLRRSSKVLKSGIPTIQLGPPQKVDMQTPLYQRPPTNVKPVVSRQSFETRQRSSGVTPGRKVTGSRMSSYRVADLSAPALPKSAPTTTEIKTTLPNSLTINQFTAKNDDQSNFSSTAQSSPTEKEQSAKVNSPKQDTTANTLDTNSVRPPSATTNDLVATGIQRPVSAVPPAPAAKRYRAKEYFTWLGLS